MVKRATTTRRNRHENVPLVFSEKVSDAISAGQPMVALESNVITHGLVYPENAATASKVEEPVRAGGVVPATIGIEGGRIMNGMTDVTLNVSRRCWAAATGIPRPAAATSRS